MFGNDNLDHCVYNYRNKDNYFGNNDTLLRNISNLKDFFVRLMISLFVKISFLKFNQIIMYYLKNFSVSQAEILYIYETTRSILEEKSQVSM